MAIDLITVFGGSGFIGRALVQRLAETGACIRVAVRDPEQAMPLKPLGDVGQIVPIQANVRNDASVRAAVAGAGAVVNLVGILYPSGAQTFEAVHRQAAERIAKAAAAEGASRFVHMSALGVAKESPSVYARTKAAGEEAVRAAFPAAAIIRPSVVFGPGDGFFNLFASLARFTPVLPLVGGGATRFQPVYVGDVADAMAKILADPTLGGKTYELGGPHIYTFKELMQLVLRETGMRRLLVPVPFGVASFEAAFLEMLPKPPLTRDQVALLRSDNVVGGQHPGLADLGITPTAAEVILPFYMDMYRKGGRYTSAQPV